MKKIYSILVLLSFLVSKENIYSQSKIKNTDPVYVDKKGIMRWTKNNAEAAFFGVNYTVPFAYGYRSHKVLNVDIEKAIDNDVYHFARLGLDAFRVHVWDVEITDSLGNLLQNEHLRLFDYLLFKLKQRNIKILITPIAFWGNGYPERDIRTNGFSYVYGKGPSVVKEEAFKAQENYLKQFFTHINPYTKLTYKDDPDVIAMEINNEPHHSGQKERTTEYVNRMTTAVKSTGWMKPVFYNISESPLYADAVVKAKVDGHSFQWYPSGLVAGREQKGNFLPHVDQYYIPFIDTIPAFKNRARMVYEFDAGDIMQPYMYPAMIRSYRIAGFQWATQFAYDPMATAYANTEYQTHYLNLAYTPAKAISLLIAAKAFHQLPLNKTYGIYPADTLFGAFRVSYKEQLSEMNGDEEFYYSNSTTTQPKNISKLRHIAGTGSSPVVEYEGTGAYFLDKINDDTWRLEVMPDAIAIHDPFEKASPKKPVTVIRYRNNRMQLMLDNIGEAFSINAVNDNNTYNTTGWGKSFFIQPGSYIITKKSTVNKHDLSAIKVGAINMKEFIAPTNIDTSLYVVHTAYSEVSAGKPFELSAKIVGLDTTDKVSAEIRNSSNKWKTIQLQRSSAYNYSSQVPADVLAPGVLNYRIIIQKKNNDYYTFPGGYKGYPYAWDYYRNDSWQTFVATEKSSLQLFNPLTDRNNIMIYNTDWRNNNTEYITAEQAGELIMRTTMNKPAAGKLMGWQYYFGEKIKQRSTELSSFKKLLLKARSANNPSAKIKVSLINSTGAAFSKYFTVNNTMLDFEIDLSSLQPDSSLLLPRPYPGFLPLWFKANTTEPFNIANAEKIEITFGHDITGTHSAMPYGIEVAGVWLKK